MGFGLLSFTLLIFTLFQLLGLQLRTSVISGRLRKLCVSCPPSFPRLS
jgi:hypothetical protein